MSPSRWILAFGLLIAFDAGAAAPGEAPVDRLDLDVSVRTAARMLGGTARFTLKETGLRLTLDRGAVDLRACTVDGVDVAPADGVIKLPAAAKVVSCSFETREDAFLALDKSLTTSGRPFLAAVRPGWFPRPRGARIAVTADVRVAEGLLVLLSGVANPTAVAPDGGYHFESEGAVDLETFDFVVGAFEYRAINRRTGVYAEHRALEPAAGDLARLGPALGAGERLFGPMPEPRLDVVVLPRSYDGDYVSRPRLLLASPTLVTNTASQFYRVVREVAHAFPGNTVGNERRLLAEEFGAGQRDLVDLIAGRPAAANSPGVTAMAAAARAFVADGAEPAVAPTTLERTAFLRLLPARLERRQLALLDRRFELNGTVDADLRTEWLKKVLFAQQSQFYPDVTDAFAAPNRAGDLLELARDVRACVPRGDAWLREIIGRNAYRAPTRDALMKIADGAAGVCGESGS